METAKKYVVTIDFGAAKTIHAAPLTSAWLLTEPNGAYLTGGGTNTYVGHAVRQTVEHLYSTAQWTPYIEAMQRPPDVRTQEQRKLINEIHDSCHATEVVFALPFTPTGAALIALAAFPEIKV